MDLSPFKGINPCGYAGLQVTQLRDLGITEQFSQVSAEFLSYLTTTLCTSAIPL